MEHAGTSSGGAAGRRPAAATDEVDDLVAAWQAERPDLDVQPMQVLSRISRLARHLDRERRSAFAAHDLESWEFDVLAALRRQGAPYELSPGALLRATMVTSGTMTNRIDRLEQAGLVRRRPDPQDKRGVLVTLTAAGQSRVDATLADLLEKEQALLAGLDREQPAHPGRPAARPARPPRRRLSRPDHSASSATASHSSSSRALPACTSRSCRPEVDQRLVVARRAPPAPR